MMDRTIMMTLVVFGLGLGLGACGDDGGSTVTDSGTDAATDGGGDGGGGDAAIIDCEGMADGTVCMEGFICLRGTCSPSECGDGFVDEARLEICDDGNDLPGDGCEPSVCVYTCADDTQCDNGNVCDGAETCNASLHRCQAGAPVTAVACTQPSGDAGVCAAGGLCAPPGCGDGSVDGMEDCDDMNDVSGDGCEADCTFSCTEDTDCTDGDECTGVETCDVGTHTCVDPADLDCDDGDTCTADSCDAMTGCVNALVDGDGDGFATPATCTTAGLLGGDCDDSNSTVYPGAPELCDMIDNDCDMAVDNDTTIVTCYQDRDGDEYGREASTVEACTCPAGYIPPRADGEFDCADGLASANPGQTRWFTTATCTRCIVGQPRYDYNCDGVDTKRWTMVNHTCSISRGFCGSGWTGATAPACGRSATFQPCGLIRNTSGLFVCTASRTRTQTQECH